MTPEEVRIAALAECAEFGDNFPSTKSVCYRRIGVRQQQLFDVADEVNPDFFGVCAEGVVVAGTLNLRELLAGTVEVGVGETVPAAAQRLQRIEVKELTGDPEDAVYAVGDEVSIIPLSEIADGAAVAPRVTYRDGVLRQVGTDLATVARLEVFYSRRPAAVSLGSETVELPEPYGELLVFDLAKMLVRRATAVDAQVRDSAIAVFDQLEKDLLDGFKAHVLSYAPVMRRHG
jgi:hypothetical protein